MSDSNDGLSDADQIEAVADQLTASADQLHASIMRAIKTSDGGDPDTARALLDDELVLRQRANSLYGDAAAFVVGKLGQSQQHIIALTGAANEQLAKIAALADAVSLVGALLAFAGAVITRQPAPILAALEKIAHQVQSVKADRSPTTAS